MAGPGVIQEQGYVAGVGLGFNPLSEQDQKKIQSEEKTEKENNKNKKDN